jgi:hypothetical protein
MCQQPRDFFLNSIEWHLPSEAIPRPKAVSPDWSHFLSLGKKSVFVADTPSRRVSA